jgi:2-polyprenyl-6-methoxyphenol hydroxylase-like FAD-dependent oxidoreductase
MTDKDGTTHSFTNQHPPAKLVEDQRAYAEKILPPQFAELVKLTDKPFIQAITDVLSPQSVYHDGRVVLVGDALAGFRPHTAASTSQGAFHALRLSESLRQEKIDWDGYNDEVMEHARNGVKHGQALGNRSQFQKNK